MLLADVIECRLEVRLHTEEQVAELQAQEREEAEADEDPAQAYLLRGEGEVARHEPVAEGPARTEDSDEAGAGDGDGPHENGSLPS